MSDDPKAGPMAVMLIIAAAAVALSIVVMYVIYGG